MSTAAKLKKTVGGLLATYEKLALREHKIEAQRLAAVLKQQQKFDKACAPINSAALETLDPLRAEMRTLAAEIERELKSGIAKDGKTASVLSVETDKAIAELKDNGHRKIEPSAFFEEIPPGRRTLEFWQCVDVRIGKAEKYLPEDAMTRLAGHEPSWKVLTRLKK
jgi:hypothetical protein